MTPQTDRQTSVVKTKDRIFPYQAWWGLVACALLMGVIMLLAPYTTFELQPRQFTFDYPWKLPNPSTWTRTLVWSLYALHQVGIWFLIYKAQSMQLRYVNGLHWVNVQAFALNGFFVALHIAQTKLTYDGLAQDVHEVSALASVALMLFVILVMENDRRGLIFGKRVPLPLGVGEVARKYHGYFFSWAITYTFWYHPMEITGGHLLGFLYMFLLLLQGSLFYTRIHVNNYWKVVSEVSVVAHGVMVAILAGQQWPQFFGGFLGMFIVTQMHGLGLSKATRWIIGLAYIASILAIYSLTEGLARAYMVTLIPLVEFVLVAIVSLLVWLVLLLLRARAAAAG